MKKEEIIENKKYRDSVFVDLFMKDIHAKENFLSLYNALHDSDLKLSDVSIESEIIDQTLYHSYYNDVSMMINGKLIVLVEHQSTINENMPLRFLDYVVRLYEKIVPQKSRYKMNLVHIPTPEFYVFYNGTDPYPDIKTLRLSDAYIKEQAKAQLELTVDVYNIANPDPEKSLTILNKCAILKQYCEFVEQVRKSRKQKSTKPITDAISYCKENNILTEYLNRKDTEVNNLLVANYDPEMEKKVYAEEAAEEAYAEGENKRAREAALRMLKDARFTIKEIAEFEGLTIEEVTKLQQELQA